MDIIGFTGKIESGKSTAAYYAGLYSNRWNTKGHYQIRSFAAIFKQIMMDYFHFTQDDLYTPEGKKKVHPLWGITPREFMQKFGEGMKPLFGEDFWVKLTDCWIDDLGKGHDIVHTLIFDDVRRDNEAELIKRRGGKIIHVIRPDWDASFTGIKGHISEAGISPEYIDYTVINPTNDREKFKTAIQTAYDTLFK